MIGVLMSATLPARLGEPARALSLARRTGRVRETFPVIVGTLVSQTMLNIVALLMLGVIIVSTTAALPLEHPEALRLQLPAARAAAGRPDRAAADAAQRQRPLARLGAAMHKAPWSRSAPGSPSSATRAAALLASAAQLGAWAIQLASCWALFAALGLDDRAGIGAAAAVLFAVNVTAVVPVTPSNIGIFQLAVFSVLTTGWGIGQADALAYGVILQAVEIATAVVLGLPSLVREGLTWSDLRVQALSASPVQAAAEAAPARRRGARDVLAWPRPSIERQLLERRGDLGVELGARAGAQLGERLRERHRLAVGAGRRHRAEGVAAGDDPGLDRDLLAGEAVRVAAAVVVLVRGADDAADLGEDAADPVEHLPRPRSCGGA